MTSADVASDETPATWQRAVGWVAAVAMAPIAGLAFVILAASIVPALLFIVPLLMTAPSEHDDQMRAAHPPPRARSLVPHAA
jgi:hypothetical protein